MLIEVEVIDIKPLQITEYAEPYSHYQCCKACAQSECLSLKTFSFCDLSHSAAKSHICTRNRK